MESMEPGELMANGGGGSGGGYCGGSCSGGGDGNGAAGATQFKFVDQARAEAPNDINKGSIAAIESARKASMEGTTVMQGEQKLAAVIQAEAALCTAINHGSIAAIEQALESARTAGVEGEQIMEGEQKLAAEIQTCQSNLVYMVKVSRLSPEQIQVCCTNMAGQHFDIGPFGNNATLMELKDQVVKNTLVEKKCQEFDINHPSAIFLLDDGTQVQITDRIADYEGLTFKMQENSFYREVKANKNTHSIKLQSRGITDDDAKAIAAALPALTNLGTLNLQSNNIGDAGAKAIAAALPALCNPATLTLQTNHIGADAS